MLPIWQINFAPDLAIPPLPCILAIRHSRAIWPIRAPHNGEKWTKREGNEKSSDIVDGHSIPNSDGPGRAVGKHRPTPVQQLMPSRARCETDPKFPGKGPPHEYPFNARRKKERRSTRERQSNRAEEEKIKRRKKSTLKAHARVGEIAWQAKNVHSGATRNYIFLVSSTSSPCPFISRHPLHGSENARMACT